MENPQENEIPQGDQQLQHIKGVIEVLLFISEKPVTLEQIRDCLETVSPNEIKKAIGILSEEYDSRKSGVTIREIAGGYQMLSNPTYASYARSFYQTKHKEKLSKPALETLAIIAYKQPVTRADVELIRGVNSDGVVAHLLNKELIKAVGRKDVPGRPFTYGTTKQFLEYFGLKSLESLPSLEEFSALNAKGESPTANEDASSHDGGGIPVDAIEMSSLERSKQTGIKDTAEALDYGSEDLKKEMQALKQRGHSIEHAGENETAEEISVSLNKDEEIDEESSQDDELK